MALTITSVARNHGPQCEHLTVTVNDEGTQRTVQTSYTELDTLIGALGGPLEAKRSLVILWAAYRRSLGRSVTGVDIA